MFVTIVTITYNAASFIERTLQSVLNQTSTEYEYLVIDGKSTDKTMELVTERVGAFAEKGVSYQWISEPDAGIYDAMNKGLKRANGDYVWFVNAGDVIASPSVLTEILEQVGSKAEKPDFIYGETLIVNTSGEVMGKRRLKAPEQLEWKHFRMGMLVCHQSMLVRKSIAAEYDTTYRFSADFDWTIRCLKQAKSTYFTHAVISHFMEGGISKTKMRASLNERFHIMAKYYGWLPTTLRHLWFILRAGWFKLRHGWI